MSEPFKGWVILELMGHRRLAGYVVEQEVAGAGMLRIDVFAGQDEAAIATQFYSPSAVYCMTPSTELAFGPSLSTDGLGFAAAFVGTIEAGEMGIPVSLTFGGNQAGAWFTLTCGWNLRQ